MGSHRVARSALVLAACVGLLLAGAGPSASVPDVATVSAQDLPATIRGSAFESIPTRQKVVALTFDAGGGAGGVRKILRALKKYDVPATFFLTGHWARTFPGKVARIGRGGYVLGNHTDTHGKVSDMSSSRLRSELRRTDRAVKAAAGRGTKPWFRFPYGSHTPDDIARVNDLGYACIQWTVDTAGWMGTSGGQSVEGVVKRVMDGLRPGEIVLMHVGEHPTDGSTLDADALPAIIEALRAKGYGFTTVESLLPVTAALTATGVPARSVW